MSEVSTSRDYQVAVKLYLSGKLQQEDLLKKDSITIGRATGNVIQLDDERVSDLHAVIKVTKDNQLVLTDLGSDEGTFVGEDRVDMRVQLTPGTRVRVGPYDILLEVIDQNRKAGAGAVAAPVAQSASDQQLEHDSERVVQMLFANWERHDTLGIDNKSVPKVLEVYEIWGDIILSAKEFHRSVAQVMLGNHASTKPEFVIDREFLPAESVSLITQVEGRPHLVIGEKYEGWLYENGEPSTLQSLIKAGKTRASNGLHLVPLTDASRFIVYFGHIQLVGGFTLPARKAVLPLTQGVDTTYLGLWLFFLMTIGSLTLYLQTFPPREPLTIDDLDDRTAQLIAPKKEEPKKEQPKKEKPVEKKEEPKKEKPKEPEKEGKKDNKVKLPKDKVAIDKAVLDKKAAESSGLLADLKAGNSLFNTGLSGSLSNAASGLIGTTGKSAVGGVAGTRGVGFGGGGSAGGVGPIGTKGGGGGGGYGNDAGLKGRKKTSAPVDVSSGDALVLGNIEKALIEKVIRENIQQIKYCYSKELTKVPTLAGKIVVKFTIAKDGSVSQASTKDSTMGNGIVEGCVNSRIMQLRFPEPKGGGSAIVTYPFIFKAAG